MPDENLVTIDISPQKDFLLKHYGHLSELWKRRDELRIAFLRFYFLFLGGIVALVGFATKGTDSFSNFSDLKV